jgi:hypothetical protein
VRLSVDQRAALECRLFEEFERAAVALDQLCRGFVEAGQGATGARPKMSAHPADGTSDESDRSLNATGMTRPGHELAARVAHSLAARDPARGAEGHRGGGPPPRR